ncbi:hypothetical protein [Pseudomonas sp. 8BK]|uniref:hypothetical protein n=1 Tax=Pseudomonas sp. 8BK TaxID=2653164 RepID=UPI0013573FE9|nr:hypothetical protein [Pseudomonas sp. 8BK]
MSMSLFIVGAGVVVLSIFAVRLGYFSRSKEAAGLGFWLAVSGAVVAGVCAFLSREII